MMGLSESESKAVESINPRQDWPQHRVMIPAPFAVGRFAVTFDEWDACVADNGCNQYRPDDLGWGRGQRPVINISWNDAQAYVAWLSVKVGARYRLLSEAEREYVTRSGTTTVFWWGNSVSADQARFGAFFDRNNATLDPAFQDRTVPVDRFSANGWGLYQVHGNVWEWVEDCWDDAHPHAPSDSSPRTQTGCNSHVVRGGSWLESPESLGSARRSFGGSMMRSDDIGFRVAREIVR
jgi:formylglycine-generating enzyme required for sulfatase activity